MDDKKFLFEKDSIPHALGVMAFPVIASLLITLIYNLADTWFVGRTNNPFCYSVGWNYKMPGLWRCENLRLKLTLL